MPLATLIFEGRRWLAPVAIAFAAGTAFVFWSYARAAVPLRLRAGCAALKLLGLAALLACFLEPAWTGDQAKPGANLFAIVADNSESLRIQGAGEPEPRAAELRRLLTGDRNTWRAQLAASFGVRNFLADSRLQATTDFQELASDGHASALAQSLRQVADRYRGQNLAGIILLTDGATTDPGASLEGVPAVYPVLLGAKAPAHDLGIASTAVSQTSFEDAPVTVQAEVTASGYARREIVGQLFPLEAGAAKAKPVLTESLVVPPDAGKVSLRFQLRPAKTGVLFYRLHIGAKDEEISAEATAANNDAVIAVERRRGPYRVLYTAGRPNWEYKFLHRAVEADDQTQLVALMRIAKREAKFEFRGRAGESSNPLFRGFGNQAKDEVEQYDQPVFVRLNTEDAKELSGGFPKTPEELFRYRALILHDVEAEFFTAAQMSLIQRFVSERGGTLLMLGGAEGFVEGKYQHTAVGDMLPIYLDRPAKAPPAGAQVNLALTREGWLQPWVRLRSTESEERRRLGELPPLDLLNRAGAAKPAASVLATVSDGRQEYPAVVTQQYGRGRTAALLIGDMFQLGMGDEQRGLDLAKAWRQIVRWLVADVPDRVEIRTEPAADGQGMRIAIKARDAKFLPLDNARVALKVTALRADGEAAPPVAVEAVAVAKESGLYEAVYIPRETGGYRVEATVTDAAGAVIGETDAGWATNLALAEYRSLAPDRAAMEAIAKQTGGKVVEAADLPALVKELPSMRMPVVEHWSKPLWHTPLLFLFALACLVGEWGLRRSRGLA
ncbi:MAG TPA: hypothetical protein VGO11_08855 [Chthoniobacteraceae bacterium]|jgi:uncharacterized membrane protein|nr:hypothetical protein [Chthoniobacteraceae bacterium]